MASHRGKGDDGAPRKPEPAFPDDGAPAAACVAFAYVAFRAATSRYSAA